MSDTFIKKRRKSDEERRAAWLAHMAAYDAQESSQKITYNLAIKLVNLASNKTLLMILQSILYIRPGDLRISIIVD